MEKSELLEVQGTSKEEHGKEQRITRREHEKELLSVGGEREWKEKTPIEASSEENCNYKMDNPDRGIAIIFNHYKYKDNKFEPRDGTEHDGEKLQSVLQNLNFQVKPYNDLPYEKLLAVIKKTQQENHKDKDCLLVAVLTHGHSGDMLSAYDEIYSISALLEGFTDEKCPSLKGKPRLFFVQACRGNSGMDPVEVSQQMKTDAGSFISPVKSPDPYIEEHFFLAFATCEGYYSWRNTREGSVFIQTLCEELQENAYIEDLNSILTGVIHKVAIGYECGSQEAEFNGKKQLPCVLTKLTSFLHFKRKPQSIMKKEIEEKLNYEESNNTTKDLCIGQERRKLKRPRYEPDANVFFFKEAEFASIYIKGSAENYDMTHKNRGFAVIVNHRKFSGKKSKLKKRDWTEFDKECLKTLFETLGFEVKVYTDESSISIKERIEEIAASDHLNRDCFVLVVLTHGDRGYLYAKDRLYDPQDLWEPFRADKCKSLAGKPKLFFIQGDELEDRTEIDAYGYRRYTIPSYADFLFVFSTVPGSTIIKGTLFIQALCEILTKYASTRDLLSVLTLVLRRVADDPTNHSIKQIPLVKSMLTRLVNFESNQACLAIQENVENLETQ